MTWFDIVGGLLIALIAWIESQRGFGRAILDVVGGIIVLRIALALAAPLGETAPLLATESANEAFWLVAVFVILGALVLLASKLIYESTLLSLDVLDPAVGALLGVVSGCLVVHLLLRTLLIAYGPGEAADALRGSFFGQELIEFRAYHAVVTALQNLGKW